MKPKKWMTNRFVVSFALIGSGIITLFKPSEGLEIIRYYGKGREAEILEELDADL